LQLPDDLNAGGNDPAFQALYNTIVKKERSREKRPAAEQKREIKLNRKKKNNEDIYKVERKRERITTRRTKRRKDRTTNPERTKER
jgi:hypothetical protein